MRKQILDLVRAGKLSLTEAASLLNVDVKTIHYYLKKGVLEQEEAETLTSKLDWLEKKMTERLIMLLSHPVNPRYEASLVRVVDVIRKIIVDIANIKEKVKERPHVEIKLQKVILSALCPECKRKILHELEKYSQSTT